MKCLGLTLCAVGLLVVCGSPFAAGQSVEFHHDARMQHRDFGTLQNAYGYVYVATDMKGHGVIRVMFSNGSSLDNARFNAQLKFLDASGGLIRAEKFSRNVEAASVEGAAEHRLSRLVDLSQFATLEVDFYLSELPQPTASARDTGSAFLRAGYSGD